MAIPQLQEYGLERMGTEAIREFVATQSTGVLGLPGAEVPYMLPMSYAFDGDDSLYFTYVLGASSQKETLSEQTDRARFLVYAAETRFNWRSALLTGDLSVLPEREYPEREAEQPTGWRPELFQRAGTSGEVAVYEFEIQSQTGLRHTGLPSGFREDES